VTSYRGFIDRQIAKQQFTEEQKEALLDEVAKMVEGYNAQTIEHRPARADHAKFLVYSRNPKGRPLTGQKAWSEEKDARWAKTKTGWKNAEGLTVSNELIGAEVANALATSGDSAEALKSAVAKRRQEIRNAHTITEGFREWAAWIVEVIESMIVREKAAAAKVAAAMKSAAERATRKEEQERQPPPLIDK
jgi:hypothetical protein